MRLHHIGTWLPSLILLAAGFGCDQTHPGLIPATGTVTLDGRPLASGTVTLYRGNAAGGTGQVADGTCRIHQSTSIRGIAPGHYQVAVQCWEIPPHAVQPDGTIGGSGRSFIPDRYTSARTSGLSVDISPESTDFELVLLSE